MQTIRTDTGRSRHDKNRCLLSNSSYRRAGTPRMTYSGQYMETIYRIEEK